MRSLQVLIVYESLYGTNRILAQAIADGVGEPHTVTLVEAHGSPTVVADDVDLLVVGGPNHKTGLPSSATRVEAAADSDGQLHPADRGVREWLADLEISRRGQLVAVWGTRMASPRILDKIDRGSRTIVKRLRRAGARLAADPEHFYSSDGVGGLVDGEVERARRWGEELARLTPTRRR